MTTSDLQRATTWLREADALLITAGAGMGVDSGLPDFRGNEGFWNAYPPYRHLGVRFVDMASPDHFQEDPAFAWGFYGHRTHLYREARPHAGFSRLLNWLERYDSGGFVVTSNVDGQFQKAGFPADAIHEVHGSIHHLQCVRDCSGDIWQSTATIPVNPETMRASEWPLCPHCGGTARPNVLMFGDWGWNPSRSDGQERAFARYLQRLDSDARLVVLEFGAGHTIRTIRHLGETLARRPHARLIRVNTADWAVPPGQIGLSGRAEEVVAQLELSLREQPSLR